MLYEYSSAIDQDSPCRLVQYGSSVTQSLCLNKMQSQPPVQRYSRYKFPRIRSLKSTRTETPPRDDPEELFSYSKPLEEVYPKPTNSFTILPCRVPLQDEAVRTAVHRLYSDKGIIKSINKDRLESAVSSTDSRIGRYSTLIFPECLPERVEIITSVIEAGFLHDGML